MSEPIEHEFEVWQDGTPVAIASSTDREQAIREIRHYAAQYRQDGPVEVKEVLRRPLELPARSDEVGDAQLIERLGEIAKGVRALTDAWTPKGSGARMTGRWMANDLETIVSSLSSYKQRVEALERELAKGGDRVYAPDGRTWQQFAYAEAERRGAAEASQAEAREALEEIAAASKCQRRLATNMAAIEHIACSVLAALSKGGSDA